MFSEWLQQELDSRKITQYGLAKMIGVTPSHINNICNRKRKPSPDLCEKIAKTFKLPPEDVFRIAGLLPQKSPVTPTLNEINYKISLMNETAQHLVLDFVEMLLKRGATDEKDNKGRME